jgi:hypothetical protein
MRFTVLHDGSGGARGAFVRRESHNESSPRQWWGGSTLVAPRK